jgi:hypothetical protein
VVNSGAKWSFVVKMNHKSGEMVKGGDSEMFLGQYQHSIDAKGRLIVPAKFRDGLGERFVVTKGLDNCLFAYPQEEWKVFERGFCRGCDADTGSVQQGYYRTGS